MSTKEEKKAEKERIAAEKKLEKQRQAELKRLQKERKALEKLAIKEEEKRIKEEKKAIKLGKPLPPPPAAPVTPPQPAPPIAREPSFRTQTPVQKEPYVTRSMLAKTPSNSSITSPQNPSPKRASLQFDFPPAKTAFRNSSSSLGITASQEQPPLQPEPQPVVPEPVITPVAEYDDTEATEKLHEDREPGESIGTMKGANAIENAQYLANCVSELRQLMTAHYDDGTNNGYQDAYQALNDVGRDQSADASERESNKLKNRYGNIVAYDSTRVRLPIINDDPDTDYINANYITGWNNPKAYIATQGPVPNSFISFWRMVWVEKIENIVMVTNEYEGGKLKCHRYWPDPSSYPPVTKEQYGNITVEFRGIVQYKTYALRTFEVSSMGQTRTVRHFYYLAWPDHGVPLTTNELLVFRQAVKEKVNRTDVPILIHCSAGVGRTGTYIAIDQLLEQCLQLGGTPNIDDIVYKMRMCRNYMVQTEMQYVFVYRAVLDALTELLEDESSKSRRIAAAEAAEAEYQRVLAASIEAANAKREDERRESEEIDVVRQDYMARVVTSADNARELVKGNGIKDRMRAIKESSKNRYEEYKKSLEEWNDRNRFEAETYDITSALSPVQSRLEALRQKGLLG